MLWQLWFENRKRNLTLFGSYVSRKGRQASHAFAAVVRELKDRSHMAAAAVVREQKDRPHRAVAAVVPRIAASSRA
eukprot:scaffold13197_cov95-Isochrysis_galbana.AAC.1